MKHIRRLFRRGFSSFLVLFFLGGAGYTAEMKKLTLGNSIYSSCANRKERPEPIPPPIVGGGYGLSCAIDHGDKYYEPYGHDSLLEVRTP